MRPRTTWWSRARYKHRTDPVVFEEEPGTSSRLHPLQHPKFPELLTYARPGDTVHISETFRLVRGTGHVLDVLDILHLDQVALRIHDRAFSAMNLTARHPRSGELLSTVKFLVRTLAAAGELQRKLTYDGLLAAGRGHRVPGRPLHRRPRPRTRHQSRRDPHGGRRLPPHHRAGGRRARRARLGGAPH
ncbi:recombinase family protein [Streptomyces sp. BBFR25]|uniref:recombinase family protein n=1 Tax=Streptomyces sp. BBFR25 TaxID=3372855 RepID=UPI0037DC1602